MPVLTATLLPKYASNDDLNSTTGLGIALSYALPANLICASRVKSNIRCSGRTAFGINAGSTLISFSPFCKLSNSASSVFIAIQGQFAQLRQDAPSPAVGASIKVLFGLNCCIL